MQIANFVLFLHSQTKRGALVQLVRIRACHARGQGFESPTHRRKGSRLASFFHIWCFRLHSHEAAYGKIIEERMDRRRRARRGLYRRAGTEGRGIYV